MLILVAAKGVVLAASAADSLAVSSLTADSAKSASVRSERERSRAALGRLARLSVRDLSGDGGDLATAA